MLLIADNYLVSVQSFRKSKMLEGLVEYTISDFDKNDIKVL